MCAYPNHQNDINFVADLGLDPVVVAFYVEYDPVVGQKASAGVSSPNIGRSLPVRSFQFASPRV